MTPDLTVYGTVWFNLDMRIALLIPAFAALLSAQTMTTTFTLYRTYGVFYTTASGGYAAVEYSFQPVLGQSPIVTIKTVSDLSLAYVDGNGDTVIPNTSATISVSTFPDFVSTFATPTQITVKAEIFQNPDNNQQGYVEIITFLSNVGETSGLGLSLWNPLLTVETSTATVTQTPWNAKTSATFIGGDGGLSNWNSIYGNGSAFNMLPPWLNQVLGLPLKNPVTGQLVGQVDTQVTVAEPCGVAADGTTTNDVQTVINQALGVAPPIDDMNGDGKVNAVDIQTAEMVLLGCVQAGKTSAIAVVDGKIVFTTRQFVKGGR